MGFWDKFERHATSSIALLTPNFDFLTGGGSQAIANQAAVADLAGRAAASPNITANQAYAAAQPVAQASYGPGVAWDNLGFPDLPNLDDIQDGLKWATVALVAVAVIAVAK